jgi:DNA-directed RNA polymerase subunit RPC12/RpoP
MSYEGYEEYLCEKGHYINHDIHDEHPEVCEHCGSKWVFWHPVDQTNGYEEDNPDTKPAPVTKIRDEEIWRKDHLGNQYCIMRPLYKPKSQWRPL